MVRGKAALNFVLKPLHILYEITRLVLLIPKIPTVVREYRAVTAIEEQNPIVPIGDHVEDLFEKNMRDELRFDHTQFSAVRMQGENYGLIHGAYGHLEAVTAATEGILETFGEQGKTLDGLIVVGGIAGYGPNPVEVLQYLDSVKERAGNPDFQLYLTAAPIDRALVDESVFAQYDSRTKEGLTWSKKQLREAGMLDRIAELPEGQLFGWVDPKEEQIARVICSPTDLRYHRTRERRGIVGDTSSGLATIEPRDQLVLVSDEDILLMGETVEPFNYGDERDAKLYTNPGPAFAFHRPGKAFFATMTVDPNTLDVEINYQFEDYKPGPAKGKLRRAGLGNLLDLHEELVPEM